jgi:uncharacterized protein YceK
MKARTRIARSWRRRSLALAAALALSGCSSVVTTTTSYDVYFRSGVLSEFGYAAGRTGGVMPVAVVGNPFDLPKARVDEAVVAAMQGRNAGAPVRFALSPEDAERSGYEVIMAFGAGPGVAGALCVDRSAFPAPPAGSGTLLAVFCGGTDARSWAFSSIGPVASPDGPLFREMVGQTTFLMIPNRDDDYTSRSVFR